MAKLPVRNKSKDNPYTLGYDEYKKIYTVEFVDNKRVIHKVEISEEIYEAFDRFELEDVSQIHKYQRHIEHSEVYEETINTKALNKSLGVDEIVELKLLLDGIKEEISKLSDTQKRRIRMYYFDELTLDQIAEIEGTTHQAISKSIIKGIEEIKKIIKN